MWPKERLLWSIQSPRKHSNDKGWHIFVADDKDDFPDEPNIWLFVGIDGQDLQHQLYYSTFEKMTEENKVSYKKAFDQLSILIPKLYGQTNPKKMKPAIKKILETNLTKHFKDL